VFGHGKVFLGALKCGSTGLVVLPGRARPDKELNTYIYIYKDNIRGEHGILWAQEVLDSAPVLMAGLVHTRSIHILASEGELIHVHIRSSVILLAGYTMYHAWALVSFL